MNAHPRSTILTIGSLALSLMIWSLLPAALSQTEEQQNSAFENYDIRDGRFKQKVEVLERLHERMGDTKKEQMAKRVEVMKEAKAKLERAIPRLRVKFNDDLGAPEIVDVGKGSSFLTPPSNMRRETIVRDFIKSNRELYGLGTRELSQFETTAAYTNPDGNLSWVYLERRINGLPVFRSQITAAFTKQGELVRTVGEMTSGLEAEGLEKVPTITAREAVAAAGRTIGMTIDPASLVIKEAAPDGTRFVFEPGPFAEDIKVELQYFPLEAGVATLAWSMVLWQDDPAYYTLIDAEGGELLWRKNITNDQTQTATYAVYDADSPAPLSPTNASPGSGIQGALIGRATLTLISEGFFNDLGWITDGGNTTTGNNVDAGLDLVSPNGIDVGGRPTGSPFRVFDFSYNPAPGNPPPGESPALTDYRWGEVTNMFFWSNRYHDRLYELGFTEPARNFQTDNFGRGGLGNDFVRAEAQDFSGTNNANFATPPDGQPPRMQMFIFNGPDPDRTSGLDQEIVIHELTHGTSNRLHNNAAGLNNTMSGGMGEGWSDFYALALLSEPGDDPDGVYPVGGYSTLNIVSGFTDNYYYGIRRFPYAVKSNVGPNGKPHNPITFADLDPTQINLTDGAYPRGPIGSSTAFQVHNIGEIWCVALWEVRARIIARMGFAAGNQRMLQLVTDAMKLDPVNPTLLEGRDSLLLASVASGGGAAEEADIWAGFATRGMGASASAVSSSSSSVVEAFDVPNLTLGTVTLVDEDCPVGNNAADPGETVSLAIQLHNPFEQASAVGTTATIVGGGSADYGTIAPKGSATRNISFTVPSNAECGSAMDLTIEIHSSMGPVTRTHALQIGRPTGLGPTADYSTGDIAVPIPDVSTVEVPIEVTDFGVVGDVNVRVRLNHTFDGDLQLRLIAPDGTIVPLSNNRGGSGDNFGTGPNDCSGTFTVFDDSAATAISAGTAPLAGTFRPEAPLSAFNGKAMNGTWKLRVTDTASLDTGTVGCAQLEIRRRFVYCCGVEGTPVIDPATPAVLTAECGVPANGAPDPGELVTLSFPLQNVGSDFTTDLVATLLPGGGVHAPSGPQSYGVLSPIGPPVSRQFTFVPDGACGSDITATLRLQDGAVDLGTVSFTIRLGATLVGGASGSNATPIIIPATGTGTTTGAPSNPYPSTIDISGVMGTVTKVTATITNFSHTFPDDVDILLVGPTGQRVILMSDAGGSPDVINVTITFDDDAASQLPDSTLITSGTYRPTNYGTGDSFPAPAPGAPYGSTLSVFNNVDPNGEWRLFVVDDAGTDVGIINGGWSLQITTADPVCTPIPVPNVTGETVDKPALWPPNHKMQEVTVGYDPGTTCASCSLSVESNEPVNGTGDGDTAPDWEVLSADRVRLRAERAGTGTGRIYTITITCINPVLGTSTKTVAVHVAHNITRPMSGSMFKINTPVSFAGEFWDAPGRTHTARWLFDGLSTTGTVTEPTASRRGAVTGVYSFSQPGVYKTRLDITDDRGVTSYVTTNGDLEALTVVYDPRAGYSSGGGWFDSPAGALASDRSVVGKVAFGFSISYFRNATRPRGETKLNFSVGDLDFTANNFDYLVINGAKAHFRGFGKVNGEGAYRFILTVKDGQVAGGGGVDRIRMKIWNMTTGAVVYDNQMGASDAADPIIPIGDGGNIVIVK